MKFYAKWVYNKLKKQTKKKKSNQKCYLDKARTSENWWTKIRSFSFENFVMLVVVWIFLFKTQHSKNFLRQFRHCNTVSKVSTTHISTLEHFLYTWCVSHSSTNKIDKRLYIYTQFCSTSEFWFAFSSERNEENLLFGKTKIFRVHNVFPFRFAM